MFLCRGGGFVEQCHLLFVLTNTVCIVIIVIHTFASSMTLFDIIY